MSFVKDVPLGEHYELIVFCVSGSWDVSKFGRVYGLATGPYGSIFALCWKEGPAGQGPSTLVRLHSNPGEIHSRPQVLILQSRLEILE